MATRGESLMALHKKTNSYSISHSDVKKHMDQQSVKEKLKDAVVGAAKDTAKFALAGGVPVAGAAKVATTVVKKVVEKAGEKGATKVGFNAGKARAEEIKPAKYPSAKGKEVNSKVDGKVTTTSESGREISKPAESVKYKKQDPTEDQRLGVAKANETKRVNDITGTAKNAESASQKVIGKEVIKKNTYKTAAVLIAADNVRQRNKNKGD